MGQDRDILKSDFGLQDVLPYDDNAELNVLGTIYNHDERFTEVEDMLNATMFSSTKNQAMFRILKYIIQHNQIIDEGSVIATAEKFRDKTGVSMEEIRFSIMELETTENQTTFLQDAVRVAEYGIRRKAWEVMQRMSKNVITLTEDAEEAISETMKSLDGIRGSVNADDGIIDSKKAVRMVFDQIGDNLNGLNKSTVKTGFRFSDAKGGFRLGNLVVVGAFTSVGKSSLALNISTNMAQSGIPVAYYSLEMSAVELWARIVGSDTNISAGKILNYPLKREEVSVIDQSLSRYGNLPLYIDDKATTSFQKMLRSIRTMKKKYGIKMFAVDYLQIFSQNNKSKNEEAVVGGMVRELKNICRELDLIGIVLSQLRRDKEERHPTIDMLRGSGQIEESADIIVLIDRPEAHPEWGVQSYKGNNTDIHGTAELRVCKGRNIGLGTYYVGFDAQRTTFYELDGYAIGDEIGYDGDVTQQNTVEEPKGCVQCDMPF